MLTNVKYQYLPITALIVDQYQKLNRLNLTKAKIIAANWNPFKVGVIKVSLRNGQYFIVDGQHRVTAAKIRKDITHLMCAITEELTYEQEAKEFVTQSENVTPISVKQRFFAGIEANDQVTKEIFETITSLGVKITANRHKGPNTIVAVGEVMNIYKKYGIKILERTIRLLRDTWFSLEIQQTFDSRLLGGLALFLHTYGDIVSDQIFVDRLSAISPKMILAQGNSNITATSKSQVKYARPFLNYYNKNTRSGRLTDKF